MDSVIGALAGMAISSNNRLCLQIMPETEGKMNVLINMSIDTPAFNECDDVLTDYDTDANSSVYSTLVQENLETRINPALSDTGHFYDDMPCLADPAFDHFALRSTGPPTLEEIYEEGDVHIHYRTPEEEQVFREYLDRDLDNYMKKYKRSYAVYEEEI